MLTKSTKRLMLRALADLADGFDICIVAYPHTYTIEIARKICKLARDKEILCANLPECKNAGPRVKVREYRAAIPWPTPKSKVHIDVSACFERSCFRPNRVQTIIF